MDVVTMLVEQWARDARDSRGRIRADRAADGMVLLEMLLAVDHGKVGRVMECLDDAPVPDRVVECVIATRDEDLASLALSHLALTPAQSQMFLDAVDRFSDPDQVRSDLLLHHDQFGDELFHQITTQALTGNIYWLTNIAVGAPGLSASLRASLLEQVADDSSTHSYGTRASLRRFLHLPEVRKVVFDRFGHSEHHELVVAALAHLRGAADADAAAAALVATTAGGLDAMSFTTLTRYVAAIDGFYADVVALDGVGARLLGRFEREMATKKNAAVRAATIAVGQGSLDNPELKTATGNFETARRILVQRMLTWAGRSEPAARETFAVLAQNWTGDMTSLMAAAEALAAGDAPAVS